MSLPRPAQIGAIDVVDLTVPGDMLELEEMFSSIWGRGAPPVSRELMRALSLSGNYVAAARLDGVLVGGSVGFRGVDEAHGDHLHSHILGVRADVQVHGLGYAVKQHQRAWALAHGIRTITWTFDPLVRRNAHFNLTKLGAGVAAYHTNLYGAMGDGINGTGDSDRVLVAWALQSADAIAAAGGVPAEPDIPALVAAGALVRLGDEDGTPRTTEGVADVLLCQVPLDIVSLRAQRPAAAEAWRRALRETLGGAIDTGWEVRGMSRDGWYVLRRKERAW